MSVSLPDGRLIEYINDPSGRRIAKKVDGAIVEKYLWRGFTQLLAVFDGNNNLIMRFEYVDAKTPMAMTKTGTTYYLTYDQVGSLRIAADAAGNVVKRVDYDSFGNIISDTNPGIEVPFGFAGGLHDRDTGLVRFGFRDYDPDIGRWTAKDPILFDGGDVDLYGYVANNPINRIDPLGLSDQNPCSQKKSCYERFKEEFERNRVPGAEIFGFPTGIVSGVASALLTGGPSVGEKIAQHFATGAFESQRLTGHGIYLRNYRPGFFSASGAFRFLGKASWVVTVFYSSADVTTAIYTWLTLDCEE